MAPSNIARWPTYTCHKVVRAAPIINVEESRLTVRLSSHEIMTVEAESGMFSRYQPVIGDYYVVYEGDYASISPKAAFEGGYTRNAEAV